MKETIPDKLPLSDESGQLDRPLSRAHGCVSNKMPLNGGLTPLDCYHIGVLVCEALSYDPSDEVREAAAHLRGLVEASGALDSRFADLPPTKAAGAPLTPPQGGSGANKTPACTSAENNKPARKAQIWDEEKLELLRRMYDARQTDAAIAEAVGLKAQQVANRISYELKQGTLRKVDRSGNIGRKRGIGGWKATPESRSVPPMAGEVSSYEEDGVVVTKCPPGYAIGATPQKNVGCTS